MQAYNCRKITAKNHFSIMDSQRNPFTNPQYQSLIDRKNYQLLSNDAVENAEERSSKLKKSIINSNSIEVGELFKKYEHRRGMSMGTLVSYVSPSEYGSRKQETSIVLSSTGEQKRSTGEQKRSVGEQRLNSQIYTTKLSMKNISQKNKINSIQKDKNRADTKNHRQQIISPEVREKQKTNTISLLESTIKQLQQKLIEKQYTIAECRAHITKLQKFIRKISEQGSIKYLDGDKTMMTELDDEKGEYLSGIGVSILEASEDKSQGNIRSKNMLVQNQQSFQRNKSNQVSRQKIKDNLYSRPSPTNKKQYIYTQNTLDKNKQSPKSSINLFRRNNNNQTAKNIQPQFLLQDSNTHFFYPNELENLKYISQIYQRRKQQPIRCYLDSCSQLKYQDTHTFVYNKNGSPIRLSIEEKKCYIDRGFIIDCSSV